MSFFEKLSDSFTAIWSDVWTFLHPLIRVFMSEAGQILGQIALQTVMDIAKDPSMVKSEGLAKRQAAFEKITAQLKDKGIVIAESMVNAAIEAAVQKAKADGEATD